MDYKKGNLNKDKKERIEQEMKECSFKPKIIKDFMSERKPITKNNIY